MSHASPAHHGGAHHLERALRIAWNVVTLSETGRRYPDRARQVLWQWLSTRHPHAPVTAAYGRMLHRRNRHRQERRPDSLHTFFLRNPIQLEVLRELASTWFAPGPLRVASIGCSTGAELYSALWSIRRARPDLAVSAVGLDLSESAVDLARTARYHRTSRELARLAPSTFDDLVRQGLFELDGDAVVVRPEIAAGTQWVTGDVFSPTLAERVGVRDVVLANNLLCHFHDAEAAAGLRNIARLLAPHGHLFVQNVDLDVKTRVVTALGLRPVTERIQELYEGDAPALQRWPVTYWGPEPFSRRRRDWAMRYATVYQRGPDLPA